MRRRSTRAAIDVRVAKAGCCADAADVRRGRRRQGPDDGANVAAHCGRAARAHSAARRSRAKGADSRRARRSRTRRQPRARARIGRGGAERRGIGRGRARIGRSEAGAGASDTISASNSCVNEIPRRRRSWIARPPSCRWRRRACGRPTHALDEASASVAAAQAAVRAAEVAASFSTIAAPFDGFVTNRASGAGKHGRSRVRRLLTMETTDGFRLEVQIDAARARVRSTSATRSASSSKVRTRRTP